jgi:hypothetical protein
MLPWVHVDEQAQSQGLVAAALGLGGMGHLQGDKEAGVRAPP